MDRTEVIKKRYNRTAKIYRYVDRVITNSLRAKVLNKTQGKILEVGVGTGLNLPLYPPGSDVTGIDFSPGMLSFAQEMAEKAGKLGIECRLLEMDVQNMSFPDQTFDTVIATCVFCSVPDPIRGLREVKRVCKPGGQVILLEHVRSKNLVWGKIMDILNPLVSIMVGDNINRDTLLNIQKAGFRLTEVINLKGDVLKLIQAKP